MNSEFKIPDNINPDTGSKNVVINTDGSKVQVISSQNWMDRLEKSVSGANSVDYRNRSVGKYLDVMDGRKDLDPIINISKNIERDIPGPVEKTVIFAPWQQVTFSYDNNWEVLGATISITQEFLDFIESLENQAENPSKDKWFNINIVDSVGTFKPYKFDNGYDVYLSDYADFGGSPSVFEGFDGLSCFFNIEGHILEEIDPATDVEMLFCAYSGSAPEMPVNPDPEPEPDNGK